MKRNTTRKPLRSSRLKHDFRVVAETQLAIKADLGDWHLEELKSSARRVRAKIRTKTTSARFVLTAEPHVIAYLRDVHQNVLRLYRETKIGETAEARHFARLDKLAAEFKATTRH